MITFPIQDVNNTEWATYQVSTGEIIHRRRPWGHIEADENGNQIGLPIYMGDPDHVYLRHIDGAEPPYDSRLFQMVGTETNDLENNTITMAWVAVRRPLEEAVMAAQNIEAEKLEALVGQLTREVIETRLIVGGIIKYALKNQIFPAKVQTLIDAYEAKAVKVWQNRDRLTAIVASLQAGEVPNLDDGWTTE